MLARTLSFYLNNHLTRGQALRSEETAVVSDICRLRDSTLTYVLCLFNDSVQTSVVM
jgi:hypothetical protein